MHSSSQPLVVLTPYYEDREAIRRLFTDLHHEFGKQVHLVVIDDGSVHEPLDPHWLLQSQLSGEVVYLKRNLGHQRAIAVGINYVAQHHPDQIVVVMDSDGEDRPASIQELLTQLEVSPQRDVVVATRKSRVESWRFQFFYFWYKYFFELATGRHINFGNFMALRPAAVARLAAMQELWIHFAGTVLLSKLRISECPIARGARYAGKSKMNFVGLVLHGFKGLMVFAEDVLVRVGIACAFIGIVAVLGTFATFALKLFGITTPGWFSVALGLLFLIFLQMIVLSIMALMMLMLTGVIRGGVAIKIMAYSDFIEEIIKTKKYIN